MQLLLFGLIIAGKGDFIHPLLMLMGDMVYLSCLLSQVRSDTVTLMSNEKVTDFTETTDVLWPSLAERARFVIATKTPDRGRFRALAEASGIGAETWKSFWYGRQRATEEMLGHVFAEWPEMAFWVATGLTDVRHGHVSPPHVGQLESYPMRPMPKTAEYYKTAISILRHRQVGAWPPIGEIERLEAAEEDRSAELGYSQKEDEAASLQRLASTVEGIKLDDEDSRPLIARLLVELQTERFWSDQDMAGFLDISEAAYRQVRSGAVELLTSKQRFRIFDRWGYDRVRNALLTVLPTEWAERIKELDNKRGKKVS